MNPSATLTGANAGQTIMSNMDYGSNTIWLTYYGIHPGVDTVTIKPTISGCNYRIYHPKYTGSKVTQTVVWNVVPPVGSCPRLAAANTSLLHDPVRTRQYQIFRNRACFDDPVAEGFGDYESSVTDATVAAPGLPFEFTRTFSSGYAHQGDLGYGWSEPYGSYLTINTSSSPNTVTAYLADGQQIQFAKSGSNWVGPGTRPTRSPTRARPASTRCSIRTGRPGSSQAMARSTRSPTETATPRSYPAGRTGRPA